jgi:hypothetical protein
MSENDPERGARRMRDPEALSDQNQFAAVGRRDRRSECPAKKKERSKKHRAGAELRYNVILSEAKRGRRIPWNYLLALPRDSSTSLGMTALSI